MQRPVGDRAIGPAHGDACVDYCSQTQSSQFLSTEGEADDSHHNSFPPREKLMTCFEQVFKWLRLKAQATLRVPRAA
eukprot:4441619-Lingulodinium_polyedra.AAC.1